MNKSAKLSVFEKTGYGLGDLASNLFFAMFLNYLSIFYTDIFGITAASVGTMMLVTRIWDAFTDPIMGMIADRTQTRWGKFRPYLLWGALPFGIAAILNFTTPDLSPSGKLIYAYFTYSLMMLVYTFVNIPYSSLMGVLSSDSNERTSLSSYRFVGAFVGGLIVISSNLYLVHMFGKNKTDVIQASIENNHVIIKETGTGKSKIELRASDSRGNETVREIRVEVNKNPYNPPLLINPIPDVIQKAGFQKQEIDLSSVFHDKDGDILHYSATSNNDLTAGIRINGNRLILSENNTGTSEITVTADDGMCVQAEEKFFFSVSDNSNHIPEVTKIIEDTILHSGFESFTFDISGLFTDQDGDHLILHAECPDQTILSVTLIENNRLLIREIAPGIAKIHITTDDQKGGYIQIEFTITIVSKKNNPPFTVGNIPPIILQQGFGSHSLFIPSAYKDMDGDTLTYSCTVVNEATGYRWAMTFFGLLATVLFLITFFSTKERLQPPKIRSKSFLTDIKDLMHNKPWIILFFTGIFTLSYVCIRNSATMYYFKYFIGKEQWSSYFFVMSQIALILGVIATKWLTSKMGKKNLYLTCMILSTIMFLVFYIFQPGDIIPIFVFSFVGSFIAGPTVVLVWAMYADTADYSEWKTGRRATGLIFSAASFAQKMGWAFGGGLSGWLLAYYGFRPNMPQTAETLEGIKALMSYIPSIGSILAVICILFYNLSEKRLKQIATELEEKRKSLEANQ